MVSETCRSALCGSRSMGKRVLRFQEHAEARPKASEACRSAFCVRLWKHIEPAAGTLNVTLQTIIGWLSSGGSSEKRSMASALADTSWAACVDVFRCLAQLCAHPLKHLFPRCDLLPRGLRHNVFPLLCTCFVRTVVRLVILSYDVPLTCSSTLVH